MAVDDSSEQLQCHRSACTIGPLCASLAPLTIYVTACHPPAPPPFVLSLTACICMHHHYTYRHMQLPLPPACSAHRSLRHPPRRTTVARPAIYAFVRRRCAHFHVLLPTRLATAARPMPRAHAPSLNILPRAAPAARFCTTACACPHRSSCCLHVRVLSLLVLPCRLVAP